MNCSTCDYFVSKEHIQCNRGNGRMKGYSGCNDATNCVLVNLNSSKSAIEPLPSTSQSKQLIQGVEAKSRLSKEHLRMKDSVEQTAYNTVAEHDALTIEKNCSKNGNGMNILFMNATLAENSVCLNDHSEHKDIGESFNADELSKVENNKSLNNSFGEYKDVKKENVFLFKQDPNDSNTAELRFMDSTDSLRNFLRNPKPHEQTTELSNNDEQQISLSAQVLRDFDSENSANSREIVDYYLQTYSPTTLYQSLVCNCPHLYCHFSGQPREQKSEMTMKTVSVSTESEPSLKSTCFEKPEEILAAKLKPHNYLIMQAVGVSPAVQCANMILDKNSDDPSIDMRMQTIFKTLKEDTKVTKFVEKSHLIKMPTQTPAKALNREEIEKRISKKEDKSSDLIAQLLNTHRGVYNPPNPLIVQQEPPLPQYQTLPCSSALAQELLLKRSKVSNIKPVPSHMLNIPRAPIQCPESTCQRMIFVSNFNKHLVVDHSLLPMERITSFQCKNFFLDARLFQPGASKCHLLYLLRGKVTDLGSSEYKDFLPILVMTSRVSLNQMCGLKNQTSTIDYFIIWVTGIAPEELPISVSLTVWSRSGRVPSCHVVYSGQMYSIRNNQSALDVWQSGRMLLLSSQEIDALTANGKDMLNLQLSVH